MIGVDLGGTFTKIVHLKEDGEIRCDIFRTKEELVKEYFSGTGEKTLAAFVGEPIKKWAIAGAGSLKFGKFLDSLTPAPIRVNEMKSNGIGTVYQLDHPELYKILGGPGEVTRPYVIASMGTGVSFNVADGEGNVKHVGGTAVGGGTLMALSRLIFGITDFSELIKLAAKGKAANVDLLIRDIVGEDDYGATLKMDCVASSMAKAAWTDERPPDCDIAAGLVQAISFSIGAHLGAVCGAHGARTAVFVGGFLDEIVCNNLQKCVNVWHPEVTLVFPKFHHHCGALGAAITVSKSE